MDISCFQVQQWSYATIWVSLAQCTSQKERSRSNAKLSHKADSRKMDEADLPFVSCVELCSVMCPRRCYTCSDWNSSKMTDCTACAFFFFSLSLFIFSMVAFVWKREAQSTIFRRLSSYYCKPSCLEGDLKFKCILSLISPPPFAFYDSLRQGPDQKEGKKKNPLIVKRAFSFLF